LAQFIRETAAPTLDPHEIATAVNDTFIGLANYAARGKFLAEGALTTLLFSIARRKACDQWRRKATYQRRVVDSSTCVGNDVSEESLSDEEVASLVALRLGESPSVNAMWRTAVEESAANEVIRSFRIWIGTLSPLQRKVAEVMALYFGDITNEEICDEIAKSGKRPPLASVKSARREISRKFEEQLKSTERNKTA